jgi:hypothetical protein
MTYSYDDAVHPGQPAISKVPNVAEIIEVCTNMEPKEALLNDFASLKWPHFDRYIWPHPNR